MNNNLPNGAVEAPANELPVAQIVADGAENAVNDIDAATNEALKSLLDLLNVKKVFYVDDEHVAAIDYAVVTVTISTVIEAGKLEQLRGVNIEGLNLDLPTEEIAPVYEAIWNGLTIESQKKILQNLLSLSGNIPYQFDTKRAERIKELFPAGIMSSLDPHQWDAVKDNITQGLRRIDKVLVLFDQDLRGAGGRFLVNKGEHLIKEIKARPFKNQVICTLLTHLIDGTGSELGYRQRILDNNKGELYKSDFFALTKIRIDDNALLADGVKKALLNRYCEFIKDHSVRIIRTANQKVLEIIKQMDTYDFDHTVLRSSFHEGVWEAETLFRISRNIYDLEVKKLMLEKSYPARVNKQIKQAKALSDIRFTINELGNPYIEKYKLRHLDIYEPGNVINPLHLSLENGDIFEVTTGKNKGKFILVAQECDLMMRTNPLGSRIAKLATLLPINIYDSLAHRSEVVKHFQKNAEKNHYLSTRFPLEYFNYGTNDIAIVNLGKPITVDLDALDLVVFDTDGIAQIDINTTFNINLVNSAWESRYAKLLSKFKKEAKDQAGLLAQVPKVDGAFKTIIQNKIYLKLSPVKDIGPSVTFNGTSIFSFGIRRTMRLKYTGSKYLLDRYYKHLSRTAEQHDFAVEV